MTHPTPDRSAALSVLGTLEAVTFHRYATTPNVVYIRAYDFESDNQVVWAVTERIVSDEHLDVIIEAVSDLLQDMAKEYPDGSYACGLAFYRSRIHIDDTIWELGVKQLSRAECESIIALGTPDAAAETSP